MILCKSATSELTSLLATGDNYLLQAKSLADKFVTRTTQILEHVKQGTSDVSCLVNEEKWLVLSYPYFEKLYLEANHLSALLSYRKIEYKDENVTIRGDEVVTELVFSTLAPLKPHHLFLFKIQAHFRNTEHGSLKLSLIENS